MSASSRPTEAPLRRSAAARFTATVDLPTPPLPEATAIVCFTPGRISEGFGRVKAGRTFAVIRTSTAVTPASSPTASSAWDLNLSRTGQAGVVSSNVKLTLPWGLTSSSLIMPRATTSRPRSGSLIVARTSRTCCEEGTAIRHRMLPRLLSSLRHEDRRDKAGHGAEPSGRPHRVLRRRRLRRLFPEGTQDADGGTRRRGRRHGLLLQQSGGPLRRRRGGEAARRNPPGRGRGLRASRRRIDGAEGDRAARARAVLSFRRLRDSAPRHALQLLGLGDRGP